MQVLSVSSLTTACCSLTASVRQAIAIALSKVSLDQFVVSLIDLNLMSSNLRSSHCVNHDSCNVLLASNLRVLLPVYASCLNLSNWQCHQAFFITQVVQNQTSLVEESEKMPFLLTIMGEALLTPCSNVEFDRIITIVNHTRYNVLLYIYNHVIITDMHKTYYNDTD